MFVELIDPKIKLCAIDGTGLRSSKYYSEAKSANSIRLGYFKGYKLHCIATVTDIIIPLVFDFTTASVYDNQLSDLLYEAKIYNPFLILADAAYDSSDCFKIASNLEINLLININMCKAKSIKSNVEKTIQFRKSKIIWANSIQTSYKWVLLAYLVDEFNKKIARNKK